MSVHDFLKSFLPVEPSGATNELGLTSLFDNLSDDLPCAPFDGENQPALPVGGSEVVSTALCLDSTLAAIAQKLNEDEREADAFFGNAPTDRRTSNDAQRKMGHTSQQRVATAKAKGKGVNKKVKLQDRKGKLQQPAKRKVYKLKLKSKVPPKIVKKVGVTSSSLKKLCITPPTSSLPKVSTSTVTVPSSSDLKKVLTTPSLSDVVKVSTTSSSELKKVTMTITPSSVRSELAPQKIPPPPPPLVKPTLSKKIVKQSAVKAKKQPSVPPGGVTELRHRQVRDAMVAAHRDAATIRAKLTKLVEAAVVYRERAGGSAAQLRKTVRSVFENNAAGVDALLDVLACSVQGKDTCEKAGVPQRASHSDLLAPLTRGQGDLHLAVRLARLARFQPTIDVCCDPRGCVATLCLKAVECACALAPTLTEHVIELAVQLQIRNATVAAPSYSEQATIGGDDDHDDLSRLLTSVHFVSALLDRLTNLLLASANPKPALLLPPGDQLTPADATNAVVVATTHAT